MATHAALSASRPVALTRGLTARVGLTAIVLASFVVRAVAAAAHPAPRYFPDEYLYTAIARALATGHAPAVRGDAASFPALLAPLLAAPFHAVGSPELAYRLTQGENAFLMSLAAVPVYLLARRLSLGTRYALACAMFAVALPDLVFSSYTLADPVAYPFALGALAAGVAALERPARRLQVAFLALAFLATFARVQYVVLFAAYVAAAFVLDRRRALRTQRLPLVLLAVPVLGALAAGASRVLGYYSRVTDLHVGGGLLHWAATDLYLLALASGVVLVPGALVALARPRGRAAAAFSALAVPFALGLLFEAALYASNGSARFQERYLFALLPLVPVAFGLYVRQGRPHARAVLLIAVALFAAAARLPVSGYAEGVGRTDSPFLSAVFRLEQLAGTANGALAVSLLAAAGALGAMLVARRGGGRIAFACTLAAVGVTAAGSAVYDAATAQQVRNEDVAAAPSWVDAAHLGRVTLVQTTGAPSAQAIEQLYWNRSITREVLLGDAIPTDVYAAPRLRVAPDGTLVGVRGAFLFQGYAATARFAGARLVARAGSFGLWTSDGAAKLSLLEEGRSPAGLLARTGRLTVWPDASGRTHGTLRFALTLPQGAAPMSVRFGRVRYEVLPGQETRVAYTLDTRGPWSVGFTAGGGVLSSEPGFSRAGAPEQRPTTSA